MWKSKRDPENRSTWLVVDGNGDALTNNHEVVGYDHREAAQRKAAELNSGQKLLDECRASAAAKREPMTKEEEIELYRSFVAKLPAGYLRSILGETPTIVEQMIKNDFNYSLGGEIRKLEQDRANLIEQIKQAGKTAEEMAERVRKLEREAAKIQESIRSMRAEARAIANAS